MDVVHAIEAHMVIKTPTAQWRKPFYNVVTDSRGRFDLFVTAMICMNVVLMAMTHEGESSAFTNALEVTNLAFLFFFWIEAFVKVAGIGFRAYLSVTWNRFDLTILVIDSAFTLLDKKRFHRPYPSTRSVLAKWQRGEVQRATQPASVANAS